MNLASLVLPEGEFRIIRCDVADRLLACHDGDAALLYLYALRHDGKVRNADAMRALHMTADTFERSLFTLSNLAITTQVVATPDPALKKPKYTSGELREARQHDTAFTQLCEAAEGLADRALSESVLRTLYTVYEHMKLPADVIYELLVYVKSQTNALKPSAIEQEAAQWLDRGVLSLHDAQEHLSRLETEKPLLNALFGVLQITGRQPSPAEKSIATYCVEKGFSPDALALACTRMQKHSAQPSMKYLRGILQRWDEKNIHTLSEITTAEPEFTKKTTTSTFQKPAPQTPAPDGKLDAWEVEWLAELEQRKRAQMEGFA